MSQYEMSGKGIQFSNWAKPIDPSDEMTFVTSVIMMLVDSLIYMILTWYVSIFQRDLCAEIILFRW